MSYHPPTDPADRPWPDDPPISAESMMEVIAESVNAYEGRVETARKMLALYAIRAVLDGADVRKVAEACGCDGSGSAPDDQDPFTIMVHQAVSMGYFGTGKPKGDPVDELISWLCGELTDFIKERAS